MPKRRHIEREAVAGLVQGGARQRRGARTLKAFALPYPDVPKIVPKAAPGSTRKRAERFAFPRFHSIAVVSQPSREIRAAVAATRSGHDVVLIERPGDIDALEIVVPGDALEIDAPFPRRLRDAAGIAAARGIGFSVVSSLAQVAQAGEKPDRKVATDRDIPVAFHKFKAQGECRSRRR